MPDIREAVESILRHRRDRLKPVEQALDGAERCLTALEDYKRGLHDAGALPSELADAVRAFPVDKALDAALDACGKLRRARTRLARDTVDIGVAGRARMGKSTLLQAISGLDNNAIPTGAGGFCTAARSEIHNADRTRARIRHHSPESFLSRVVRPYYKDLRLPHPPRDLDEFIQKPLPPLGTDAQPSETALYDVLKEIHANIGLARARLTAEERDVPLTELRDYVTKDRGGEPKYLSVERAVVETRFPHEGLPANLRLIDLPGLGELASEIATNLMQSVAESTDLVLVVRRPDPMGDGIKTEDTSVFDIMRKAVDGGPPVSEWLALVLNEVTSTWDKKEETPLSPNKDNVALMRDSARQGKLGVEASVWVADCRDPDSVRERVLQPAMRLLLDHPGALDRSCVDAAWRSVRGLTDLLAKALDATDAAFKPQGADGVTDAVAHEKIRALRADLWEGMQKRLEELRRTMAGDEEAGALGEACRCLVLELGAALEQEKRPDHYRPWPREHLATELKLSPGVAGVRDRGATNTRIALSAFIDARISPLFAKLVAERKFALAQTITDIHPMPRLLSVLDVMRVDEGFFRHMADRLERLGFKTPVLVGAFQRLDAFGFSYDTQFLPLIRDHLHPLDPGDVQRYARDGMGAWAPEVERQTDFDGMADQLRQALDSTALRALSRLNATEVGKHWRRIVFSMMEEFVDQILWHDHAAAEWTALLWEYRRILWADDYAAHDSLQEVRMAWEERFAALRLAARTLSSGI